MNDIQTALVRNKVQVEGVTYVVKATRSLSVEEMADAVNCHVSLPYKPAKRGDVVELLYSPRPRAELPRIR